VQFIPIGAIHSNYHTRNDAAHQGLTNDVQEIEVFSEFQEGLKGMDNVWTVFHGMR